MGLFGSERGSARDSLRSVSDGPECAPPNRRLEILEVHHFAERYEARVRSGLGIGRQRSTLSLAGERSDLGGPQDRRRHGRYDRPVERGSSVWERDNFAHLTSYAQAESGLLEHYSAAADQTESKAFRYLVKLLIEEEDRHHRIFVELADSLKTEAEMGEDPIVPYMDFDRADPAGVLDGTKQLLEKEKQDVLERLQRRST
jgi:hypothetical protein